jgi:hypothetical protein
MQPQNPDSLMPAESASIAGRMLNARAMADANGVGGQAPILHALTHFNGVTPEVAELLISRGADLTIRARVPGPYEHAGEIRSGVQQVVPAEW